MRTDRAWREVHDRLLEAALWLAAGEPRERVARALLSALEVVERQAMDNPERTDADG